MRPARARFTFGGRGPAVAGLAVLGLLSGCGNWSNEDAEFLAAIPHKEDLLLSSPATTTAQAGGGLEQRQDALLDKSTVLATTAVEIGAVNALVTALTTGLDFVRTLEPSVREPGKRIWGPYPDNDHPGFDVQVMMLRETTGYRYELQWRRRGTADFVGVIVGHFYGERARGGSGDLVVDFDKARAVGTADPKDVDQRSVALTYDMSGQTPNEIVLTQVSGVSVGWKYLVDPDGAGEILFTTVANFWGDATLLETWQVTARWRSDHAGRAKVTLSGGDLGTATGNYQECWGADQMKTYTWRDFSCGLFVPNCSEGDATSCVFPAL